MIEINNIYNSDCIDFMNEMSNDNLKADLILTSHLITHLERLEH